MIIPSPSVEARCRALADGCAVGMLLLSALGLASWTLAFPIVWGDVPVRTAMTPHAAVGLLLLGASVLALARAPRWHRVRTTTAVAAMVTGVVGALDYIRYVLFDQSLTLPDALVGSPAMPVAMAPGAGLSLALLGFAVLTAQNARTARARQTGVAIAASVAFLALCAHLYGVTVILHIQPYPGMALPTAAAILLACAGYVLSRPREGLALLLASEGAAGTIARRLLPVVVLVPMAISWLNLRAENAALFDESFSAAVLAVTTSGILLLMTWLSLTSLHAAEVAQALEAQRFQALVEASAEIVWTFDAEGNVIEDSPSWRAFTGQTFDEWKARGSQAAVHPDDRHIVAHAWQRATSERRPFQAEWRIHHVSGDWRWVAVRGVPLAAEDGTIRGWIGMNTDITERKRAEGALVRARTELESRVEERTAALRESLRQKEVLLREIHHRVKNNLAVVSGLLYLESMSASTPRAVVAFDESQRRLRAMALVHELLYGSKDLDAVDLGAYTAVLVRELETTCRPSGQEVRLFTRLEKVTVSIDLAVPCGLILSELISNAFKHAFPSGRTGHVVVTIARRDNQCVVEVTDDGVGMPGGIEPKSTKALGMRLVRSLTRQVRGRFDLTAVTPGTKARIVLPLDDYAPPRRADAQMAEQTAQV